MPERFIRCQLCGIPHPADVTVCPVHHKPIVPAAKMEVRPSASAPAVHSEGRSTTRRQPAVVGVDVDTSTPKKHLDDLTPRGDAETNDSRSKLQPSETNPPVVQAQPLARPPRVATGPMPSTGSASLVGKVLGGRFRVTGVIASGGMGVVYDGVQVALDRRVAIKCLHPRYASDSNALARFQHEAAVSGSFGHPNIVEVFDYGLVDDTKAPFLVMERLEGETLGRRLQREKRIEVPLALILARHTLQALLATHTRNILHRDLKPDNIFLVASHDGEVRAKVLDYGLSKTMQHVEGAERLTRAGVVMGTPSYMPPEQATGDPNLDGRVDLYALGMILYESLTGRLPYIARTPTALMAEIQRGRPPSPRLLRPEISIELDALIMKAVEPMREARFADAGDMLRALVPLDEALREGDDDPTTIHGAPTEPVLRHEPDTQPVQIFARKPSL
jgi:eukaryotic-like serine/threonine-protein kinase